MKQEMNVSLLWDGFKKNYVMVLTEEQKFCEGYFDFVNQKENRKFFVKKWKHHYYRDPITNILTLVKWDNFGAGDMQQHIGNTNEIYVSFLYGGTVDKKLWNKWFYTDSAILDKALEGRLCKDKNFVTFRNKEQKEFGSGIGRIIIEYFCEGNNLNET